MSKLKEKIKKMKCMKGIILGRRYKKDNNFKKIIDAYINGNIVLYEDKKKKLNNEKNIYHIIFDSPTSGFFACWLWGLYALYYADKFNLNPFIEWTSQNAYYEKDGIDGKNNAFEYYFEQVSNLKMEDVKSDKLNINILNEKQSTYLIDTDYTRINKKYMKLNENTKTKIYKDINELLKGKKTLAVHVRGVEWGNIKRHPIPLKLEEYIKEIDKAIEQENFEQIFLATDSDDTIEYLSNKYKDKIVYYEDVARATKGSKTLALFDSTIERKNNHYLLGLEVLRDMITLSSCQGLIAGVSNISTAAIITKLTNEEEYKYKHIFEQKINNNGISSQEAVEKMRQGKFNKE